MNICGICASNLHFKITGNTPRDAGTESTSNFKSEFQKNQNRATNPKSLQNNDRIANKTC